MLEEHLGYVGDRRRLEQYRAAAGKVLSSGDRVVDVGCGTGILGLLCLQAGATKLYAIDSTAMVSVARESLSRAGFGDRSFFFRGDSHRIELPERVDVAICDHVGYFGFDYGIVQTLQDARRRFLRPGGAIIPSRIALRLAAVESDKCRAKTEAWLGQTIPPELHWLRQYAINTKHTVEAYAEEILSRPARLGEIDLRVDNPEFFRWTVDLNIARVGVMHGLVGWFECELANGVWMTNSPLSDIAIDRPQVFLPIGEPIRVKAGDQIKATVMARPADNVLAWVVESPATDQRFKHSTWQGPLLASDDLTRSRPDRSPRLSREGAARATVLAYCNGRRRAQEIEEAVLHDHPNLFPSPEETSRFVAQVLGGNTE